MSASTKRDDKAAPAAAQPPQGYQRFYNRELSWLQFNRRVLEAARNPYTWSEITATAASRLSDRQSRPGLKSGIAGRHFEPVRNQDDDVQPSGLDVVERRCDRKCLSEKK